MYTWIWRRLPGGLPGKLAGSLVLLAAVLALLFLVVFPWASPRLPLNDVTVNGPSSPAPGTGSPAATAPATPG